MNVILLEKITNLGDIGETADVKSGFARNFLFPQGKAIPATKTNLAEFEQRKTELLAAHNEHVAQAESRKAKVDGLNLSIEVNASEEGKLYGSVGTRDIADAINAQAADAEIAKSEVLLPHGVIREVGQYDISLDLGYDVSAGVTLAVTAQDTPAGVSDDGSLIEDAEAAGDNEQQVEPVEGAETAATSEQTDGEQEGEKPAAG